MICMLLTVLDRTTKNIDKWLQEKAFWKQEQGWWKTGLSVLYPKLLYAIWLVIMYMNSLW